jgi:hypothetical protein
MEVMEMNNIDQITSLIFNEMMASGKNVIVNNDGNVLHVKVGTAETRILNWQSMTPESIIQNVKSLVLRENYTGDVLLHG